MPWFLDPTSRWQEALETKCCKTLTYNRYWGSDFTATWAHTWLFISLSKTRRYRSALGGQYCRVLYVYNRHYVQCNATEFGWRKDSMIGSLLQETRSSKCINIGICNLTHAVRGRSLVMGVKAVWTAANQEPFSQFQTPSLKFFLSFACRSQTSYLQFTAIRWMEKSAYQWRKAMTWSSAESGSSAPWQCMLLHLVQFHRLICTSSLATSTNLVPETLYRVQE